LTTVGDIAREAKVTTSGFYRHFTNKEYAVLAAVDEWCQCALPRAAVAYQSAGCATAGVGHLIASLVTSLRDEPDLGRMAMVDVLALGALGRAAHDQIRQWLANILMSAFGIEPARHVSLHTTVGAVLSGLQSYTLQLDSGPHSDPTDSLIFVALAPFAGGEATALPEPTGN
jgi:AcrR family transcriptional regulator